MNIKLFSNCDLPLIPDSRELRRHPRRLSLGGFLCSVGFTWIWLHNTTTRRWSVRPTVLCWKRELARFTNWMCYVSRTGIKSIYFFSYLSHTCNQAMFASFLNDNLLTMQMKSTSLGYFCKIFLFTGNLCCDLYVCCALRQCVLIVHLLCCIAMFAFDAISQAAARLCFKARCCVWAWRNVTVCLCRSAFGQKYCQASF